MQGYLEGTREFFNVLTLPGILTIERSLLEGPQPTSNTLRASWITCTDPMSPGGVQVANRKEDINRGTITVEYQLASGLKDAILQVGGVIPYRGKEVNRFGINGYLPRMNKDKDFSQNETYTDFFFKGLRKWVSDKADTCGKKIYSPLVSNYEYPSPADALLHDLSKANQ